MKIGILSKRTTGMAREIKLYFEKQGHDVKIYTLNNLIINESLFENDFYILKSKKLFFLYAGFFLAVNDIPVVPNPDITYKHKNRLDAHFLIKKAGLNFPKFYYGTLKALKNQLKSSEFPLVLKPIMGSGSRGVKKINSIYDLKPINNKIMYLEKFIKGEPHYNVYFIDNEICTLEKPPLSNEHINMKLIPTPDDIREIIRKWQNRYDLLFGHLDIVREKHTNKLYVVDPGTFPEFTNWKCNIAPTTKICNLLLEQYKKLKK